MAAQHRLCPACRTAFIVGGKGRPPKAQRFCSDECQRHSRYRRGKRAAILTPIQAAYLAGIVDGEGSIMIVRHHSTVMPVVSVTNTGWALLEWIRRRTKLGAICRQYRATAKRSETWFWRCSSEGAESLLLQVRRFLVLKGEQAQLAIALQQRLRDPALKADRAWQLAYLDRMKALNRRGPVA
jgi:predicted nucleic acid-binding Zn ribbon protein